MGTVRQRDTLATAINEALRAEDDLSTSNRATTKHREKRMGGGVLMNPQRRRRVIRIRRVRSRVTT